MIQCHNEIGLCNTLAGALYIIEILERVRSYTTGKDPEEQQLLLRSQTGLSMLYDEAIVYCRWAYVELKGNLITTYSLMCPFSRATGQSHKNTNKRTKYYD